MDQTMADDVRNRMRYEGARTTPPESWPALPDIPLARYTSDEFFAREQAVFRSQWLLVGHCNSLRTRDRSPAAASQRLAEAAPGNLWPGPRPSGKA